MLMFAPKTILHCTVFVTCLVLIMLHTGASSSPPRWTKTVNRASKSCDQKGSFLRSGSLPLDQQTQQSYVRVGFGKTTQGILLTFQKLPQKFFHKKLTFLPKGCEKSKLRSCGFGGGGLLSGGRRCLKGTRWRGGVGRGRFAVAMSAAIEIIGAKSTGSGGWVWVTPPKTNIDTKNLMGFFKCISGFKYGVILGIHSLVFGGVSWLF